ncbi:MAG: hypothetical protein F4X97_02075 [Boseongicola sp. SB0662_bin_57]|nr:hypothetical protein [Boseongicola sp. SB0662_bin_57]
MKVARKEVLSRMKEAAEMAALGIRSTAQADRALDWGREQNARLRQRLPETEAIEAWVQTNAERFGWGERPESSSLEHLEQVLTETVSAILQKSDRRGRIAVNAIVGKLGGVAATGGIAGLVANFGIASTGTAIASLSGAAATTAKLYWIGSLVGLGVAGGGLLLAAGGLGAGVATGALGVRTILGRARSEDDLEEHERAILVACVALIQSIREQRESGQEPSSTDLRLVAEHALIPLVHKINQHWDTVSLQESGKSGCRPFNRSLAIWQRRKLDRCRTELGRITLSAMMATDRC